MADKKILITTYHQAFLHKGGGEYELLEIALNLKKLGFIVDVYGHNSRSLEHYDVVLHFSVHSGGIEILRYVKAIGIPIVLFPNFWSTGTISDATRNIITEHLSISSAIAFKSEAEKALFVSNFPNELEMIIVQTGVNPLFGKNQKSNLIRDMYKIDTYILLVGILEEIKNQAFIIEALRDSSVPLLIIGGFRDANYFKRCKELAPAHFKFLGELPANSDLLRSAYQHSTVFLEAPLEPPGKSSLEAAISGSVLVLSDSAWTREHFGDEIVYVDPHSAESVRQGVAEALSKPRMSHLSERIMKRHALPGALQALAQLLLDVKK